MKKIKKILSLTLAFVLVLALFSGCGSKKEAGLYKDGELVKTWDELLKEVGYTDFDGKVIRFKDSQTKTDQTANRKSEITTYTSYFQFYGEKSEDYYDLVLPDGVTSIDNGAFSGFCKLKNVEIPDSVKTIGDSAFFMCAITNVEIPNSVKIIGDRAFGMCTSLANVKLSKSITSIGRSTFWNCEKLTDVEIPTGVTSIGGSAFYGCESLTKITLPDGVKKIEVNAFSGCKNLTSITIPDSVTDISGYGGSLNVFEKCDKLTIHASVISHAKKYADYYNIPFAED